MPSAASPRAVSSGFADRFARLSAGSRLLVFLTLALLPLGLLAVFASLQASRSADAERRATIRIAAAEGARRLSSEMAIDAGALRVAADAFASGGDPAAICGRALSTIRATPGEPTRFAIVAPSGTTLCGEPVIARRLDDLLPRSRMDVRLQPDGMTVLLPGDASVQTAIAFYPTDRLRRLLQPIGLRTEYSLSLFSGDGTLTVAGDYRARALQRHETVNTEVPNTPLTLVFTSPSAPFTAAEILAMLVPIIMWLVAALVAWVVFNRLVIGPLGQLRANVAGYQPGEIMQPLRRMTIPAREIEELGQTFQTISRTVAAHEEELARGLTNQTKLTREVHHRVKNNLQVVSSLINLHARGAKNPEASAAYASIGRRVDALAVVHRNHYAELEENRGVNLRSLTGELSANLRATAPGDASRLAILIDIPSLQVSQDTAIPLAFLITELVELAMTVERSASVRLSALRQDEPDRACLVVGSPALRDSEALRGLLAERYGRVIEGLSRQLRSKLDYDADAGSYGICFALIGPAGSEPQGG